MDKVTAKICQSRSEKVDNTVIECRYVARQHLYDFPYDFCNMLGIEIKTEVPYNHQSSQAQHFIKPLPNILTKHLTNDTEMWPKYLSSYTMAYNTFCSPNLTKTSP